MRGIVWYDNYKNGEEMFYNIIKKYPPSLEYRLRKSTRQLCIEFSNGDIWKLIPCNTSMKGECCNISYVEKCIDLDTLHTIIIPCTKGFPYQAFNFYGEGNLGIGAD